MLSNLLGSEKNGGIYETWLPIVLWPKPFFLFNNIYSNMSCFSDNFLAADLTPEEKYG